jgi:hypothetical protein
MEHNLQELTGGHVDFCGWPAVRLANSLIQLVAVPAIGGRVMAYDLGEHPFLFVDPTLAGKLFTAEEHQGDGSLAAWKNYGGDKTWPAPQGWDDDTQWHGPPDPLLDSGVYRLGALDLSDTRCALRMDSPPDLRTGIQIRRGFSLAPRSTRVLVDLTFCNIGARSVRWSIWDVVQLSAARTLPDGSFGHDPSCCVTAPVHPDSRFAQGYNVMFGAPDNPQWQVQDGLLRASYQWQIGKVGLDSPGGWVAFHHGSRGVAFVERFAYWPGAEYPDGGATLECWTVGAGEVGNLNYAGSGIYLMETEVLSPLYTIPPGETAGFSLEWGSCALTGPVVDVQAGGCAAERLTVARENSAVRLRGQFGVFDTGELQVVWRHPDGGEEWRETLGAVTPRQGVLLDAASAAPPPRAKVELYVIAEGDGRPRLLAQS